MSAHIFTERKSLKDECANILLIQVGVCAQERNINSRALKSFKGVCYV